MIAEGISLITLSGCQFEGQGQKLTTKTQRTPSFTKQDKKLKLTWCSLVSFVSWWLAVLLIRFTYPDPLLGECLHV